MDLPSNDDAGKRPGPVPGRWRFAGRELDETTRRLLVGAAAHPLDQGGYGVLHCLLLHSGAIVGKDALLAAGWPGRVVSENSLTKAIGRLRQLIEDADGELLCTAHGYGYRLATQAEWSPAGVPALSAAPTPAPTLPAPPELEVASDSSRSLSRAFMFVALGALALLLTGVSWLTWQGRDRSAPVASTTVALAARAPIAEGASIAVLPFEDLSRLNDQRYFSDGLSEELLDRLTKLPQLRVASRTSSFAFRNSDEGIPEIGRKLGVATVLEGSVRRDGERVRITVQLINVSDGFHLWSESYDQRMTDLFDVQDDIARSVVAALRLRLLPGQDDAVTRGRTRNQAAYNEYLAGQRHKGAAGADNQRRAIAAYERAIALDPEFSTAYAALADALGGDATYADSPAQVSAGKTRSLQLMDKAIALEPDRADFYVARADLRCYTARDWLGAQRDLDTAARLYRRRPPELLQKQTRLLAVLGRLDEAIALERQTVRTEPASTWAWGHLGYHLAAKGEYAQAREALAVAIRIRPDDDHVGYYEGVAWLLEGKTAEAIAAFERSGSVFRLAGLAAAQFDAGNESASRAALDTLIARHGPIGAYQVAEVHAWRGESDEAFEWLRRAEQQQDAGLAQLKFDPLMRRLHGDPRYRDWLVRLKLTDEAIAKSL